MSFLWKSWAIILLGFCSSGAVAAAVDNPLQSLSLDRLSATRERPLFAPTRRQPPPPSLVATREEPPAPPPPPPSIELSGVIMDAVDARALIRSASTNQIMRVRVGDEIGGWKVVLIERRQLVLSLEGRTAIFAIFKDDAGPDVPAGAKADTQN